jgi:hypothetical protein
MVQTASIATTLKAPLRETLMFVNYHLNIGVSHIYLFFDEPNDVCIEALANYQKVTCIKCGSEHWTNLAEKLELSEYWAKIDAPKLNLDLKFLDYRQILNANHAFQLAQNDGYDWLIHIDSDELIYVDESLDVLLSKVRQDIDVLIIKPLETVSEKEQYESLFEEVTLFKQLDVPWQKYLAYFFGCKRVFQGGDYFRAHRYGKSAIRTNVNIKSVDIHYPIASEKQKLKAKKFSQAQLLHFDCCDFESWTRKWIRRYHGTGAFAGLASKRKRQLAEFTEVYESGDINQLRKLYDNLYFLSSYERKVLTFLGLLKRIELDRQLFQPHPAYT